VDVVGPVPGQGFVRADGVELDAELLGFADQVERVVDRLQVELVVLQ
jgi:hypothetical protein